MANALIRGMGVVLAVRILGYVTRMIDIMLIGVVSMSNPNLLRLIKLPPDMANELKGAVEEAFKSLGNEAAVLIAYYARSRHNVAFNELPVGVEELDGALGEIFGPARRMVVNQCAEILNKRLGVEIVARTEKLSDLFRQVEKQYQQSSNATVRRSIGAR